MCAQIVHGGWHGSLTWHGEGPRAPPGGGPGALRVPRPGACAFSNGLCQVKSKGHVLQGGQVQGNGFIPLGLRTLELDGSLRPVMLASLWSPAGYF